MTSLSTNMTRYSVIKRSLLLVALFAFIGMSTLAPTAWARPNVGQWTGIPQAWQALSEKASTVKSKFVAPVQRVASEKLTAPVSRVNGVVRALTKRPQWVSPEQAASLIQPGQRVYLPIGHASIKTVLKALSEQKDRLTTLRPVEIFGMGHGAHPSVFNTDGKITARSIFVGANTRDAVARGWGSFSPVFLSRVPRLIREGKFPVDVALIQVSPPDKLGFVTLGPTAGDTLAALEKANIVIAEVNPNVPKTYGATKIHQSRITHRVNANYELSAHPRVELTDVERTIARNILSLIPEKNPTLQFGIGGIPDAVAGELAKSGRKDLRVHSEMISDGVMDLARANAIKGKVKYSFAMGSGEFLNWLNRNKQAKAYPTDYINDTSRIGKIDNFVAINSALRVDLTGQVNAQYVRDQWYSGVGGQVDFMRGAMQSKGGRAVIALPATSTISDGNGGKKLVSRIVPRLGEGDKVTTSMHDIQYVVTEFGVADLDGKSDVERAKALIAISHPQFRAELTQSLHQQLEARRQAVVAR